LQQNLKYINNEMKEGQLVTKAQKQAGG